MEERWQMVFVFDELNHSSRTRDAAVMHWKRDEIRVAADMEIVLDRVVDAMTSAGYSKKERHDLRLVMEEAIVNAIRHGHRFDSSKRVLVDCLVAADKVLVRVEDEGPGFNPHVLPDPRDPANWERDCGRGVFL